MTKRGMSTVTLWMMYLLLAIFVVGSMFYFVYRVKDSSLFNEYKYSKDIALLMNAVYAVDDINVVYEIKNARSDVYIGERDGKYVVIFSGRETKEEIFAHDNNVRLENADLGKAGYVIIIKKDSGVKIT